MTVFENDKGVLLYRATSELGVTGDWMIDSILSVEPGSITASASVWLNNDAQCCPTGSGYMKIAYKNGKLIIQRNVPQRNY